MVQIYTAPPPVKRYTGDNPYPIYRCHSFYFLKIRGLPTTMLLFGLSIVKLLTHFVSNQFSRSCFGLYSTFDALFVLRKHQ